MFYTYIEIGESTSEGVEEKKCFYCFRHPRIDFFKTDPAELLFERSPLLISFVQMNHYNAITNHLKSLLLAYIWSQ